VKKTGSSSYNFIYKAKFTNKTANVAPAVTATLLPQKTSQYSIVDGNLNFGNVPAKKTVTSTDTFTIKRNKHDAIDKEDLQKILKWQISTSTTTTTAPNVVGLAQPDATLAIKNAGLVLGTVTTTASATVAAGSVISQSPSAGTNVNSGSAVNLVVSSGPAQISVPNVVGQTQANASSAITTAGLVLGTVTTAASQTVAAGTVISQSPTAGTNVSSGSGSAVNLVVSSGPAQISVPNVVGQTQAAATTALTNAGLVLGTVTTTASPTVAAGSVISQSPTAGTNVSSGSAVNLVVSSGSAQISVPNVVGQTQAAATTALTNAGLVLGTVTTAASPTVAAGSVISQSPTAGTNVNSSSAVNLVVSSGPAQISVPNVVGQTQANATSAITSAGLVLGTVTTAASPTVAAGSVISQSPVAGTNVNSGSAVALVVSSGPSVSVMITSPPGQSSIAGDTVSIQGLVAGMSNVGVTVSGAHHPAVVLDNKFVATDVPIQTGPNTITVTATDATTGQTATTSIDITGTGPAPVTIAAEPETGLAPLPVSFNVTWQAQWVPVKINADFNGDGTVDYNSADLTAKPTYTYPAFGIYQASFVLTNAQGATQTVTVPLVVQDETALDQKFQTIWGEFTGSLSVANATGAASYFLPESRDKYLNAFNALGSKLPSIVSTFSAMTKSVITSSYGEYLITRNINGTDYAFFVYFRQASDGTWAMESL
jgi:beta-lactam-binding protein with PASTA domain